MKLNLLGMAAQAFPHPGMAFSGAAERFDDQLRLTHTETRDFVTDYLAAFTR